MKLQESPKKSLGQNFLIDNNIISKIIKIGNIQKPLLYHNIKGIHSRRTKFSAIKNQIIARRIVKAETFKLKILKFLAICFRFMPIFFIKYGYKKLR